MGQPPIFGSVSRAVVRQFPRQIIHVLFRYRGTLPRCREGLAVGIRLDSGGENVRLGNSQQIQKIYDENGMILNGTVILS